MFILLLKSESVFTRCKFYKNKSEEIFFPTVYNKTSWTYKKRNSELFTCVQDLWYFHTKIDCLNT